ncbi:efflux transporter outer membrane subunit [Pararhodobacter sp. CCB-MM2]|uniref:efflux transporter outer membrane subunit n=1 Tax=Pararhodobacter sp. CCB-MM2 TaxID=1786003 RepID=UPI00082EB57B|nr:efflux transporter outer membrane subunit [Pararhodobacter sp. CCB-MM2]
MLPLSRLLLLPAFLTLASCTVGPNFQDPEIGLSATFADGAPTPIGDVAAQQWWRSFNDPLLNDMVAQGLAQNLSIRVALSRVEEAEALARASGAPAYVTGGITGSSTRRGGGGARISTTDRSAFNASLILDFFGAERRAREGAIATLQSTELGVGEARLAFVSALISNYIDLRYYQEALAITRQSIGSRRETLELVQVQRRMGATTELSEAQTQAALDDALAALPALERGFYAASYAIATLLAQPAQVLEDRLERGSPQPVPHGANANAGVPADLLRNRPDVRSAERDYAAAVAALGEAEAARYPSVTLTGTIAYGGSWGFGPEISIPLLNQPALAAARDQAAARADQAELAWQAAVLAAVEEVQVAQDGYLRNRRAVGASQQAVTSYRRVVELSQQTFQAGSTTLLDLLESQRALASSNLALASARRNMGASWASLQVAAGRGWTGPWNE